MKIIYALLLSILLCSCEISEPRIAITEQEVIINGYNGHLMEPFVIGDYLFFNSLNDSIDTSIYYAKKVSDLEFNFIGEVQGVNNEIPHLDAVASMDLNNQFYFVSNRDYDTNLHNYQTCPFIENEICIPNVVEGDIYKEINGWLIMDAEISKDGATLIYVNGRYDQNGLQETNIGIANKTESGFQKTTSDTILAKINDVNYYNYAPSFSTDLKTLYYTRIKKTGDNTMICCAKRNSLDEAFNEIEILDIQGMMPEGPSILDNKLYYHKFVNDKYQLFMIMLGEE